MQLRSEWVRSAGVALLAMSLALLWQLTAVQVAHRGNWTSLFCIGDKYQRPPEMQHGQWVFKGTPGYDGQFYQLIAHDPLLLHGYDRFLDAPRLRFRRLLMPGLAYLLAGGQFDWVDSAYFAVCCLMIGLGSFCLSRLGLQAGRPAFCGFLFLITPATLAGMERMTVDISLTALCLACLLAARKQKWFLLWLSLTAAMLSKETGLLAIVAVVVWLGRQRRFQLAALMGSSIAPAVLWYLYVQSRTHGDYSSEGFQLLTPFFTLFTLPWQLSPVSLAFRTATLLAAAAVVWAAVRGVRLGIESRFHGLEATLCCLFALLVLLFQNNSIWVEAYGFARIYSPLLVCMIAATWRNGFDRTLAVFGMAALPMCLQMGAKLAVTGH